MSDTTSQPAIRRKQTSPLMYVLALVGCIFIGILIFAYAVTKRTNPIYVDEHSKPVNADSDHHDSSGGPRQ